MASVYPGTLPSFTDKEDNVDVYAASHINQLQDDVVALATELGTDPAGSKTDLKTRLAVSINDAGGVQTGTSFPGSPVTGQLILRTDLGLLYAYDGSAWVATSVTYEMFNSNGTFTAPADVYAVYVTMIGGGGGASGGDASAGGAGGGGGEAMIRVKHVVTPSSGYTVTVGNGGAGGTAGGNGSAGGTTSFDTKSVSGGSAGIYGGAGGNGGSANSLNASGATGGTFYSIGGGNGAAQSAGTGGGGGGSAFYIGANGASAGSNGNNAVANSGAGGGGPGSKNPGGIGGDGGSGFVLVEWFN